MKKPINLIAVFITGIVAIGLIVGAIFLILHFTGDKASDVPEALDTAHFELLRSTTLKDTKEYAEKNKMNITISDDGKIAILEDVSIADNDFQLIYYTVDSDGLHRIDGSCTVALEKDNTDELEKNLGILSTTIGEFFSLQFDPYFIFYDLEGGIIDSSVEDPTELLFNKKAMLSISAIDTDGTYWNLSMKKDGDNSYKLEFFHSFEKGVYENGSEVINLTEPKE